MQRFDLWEHEVAPIKPVRFAPVRFARRLVASASSVSTAYGSMRAWNNLLRESLGGIRKSNRGVKIAKPRVLRAQPSAKFVDGIGG